MKPTPTALLLTLALATCSITNVQAQTVDPAFQGLSEADYSAFTRLMPGKYKCRYGNDPAVGMEILPSGEEFIFSGAPKQKFTQISGPNGVNGLIKFKGEKEGYSATLESEMGGQPPYKITFTSAGGAFLYICEPA